MGVNLTTKLKFMGVKSDPRRSKISWLWNILRHGLFLHGLTNRLKKIGIILTPYYWVEEGIFGNEPPQIKGDSSTFKSRKLSLEEVKEAGKKIAPENKDDMVKGFENGQIYLGLIQNKDIAACMAIELNDFMFNKKLYRLEQNEAYLLNMWTFNSYRGKNLAPYLRYQSYLLLNEMGRNKTYSLSAFFNKSTLKFKKKLKAKNLKLFLAVNLFNKYHRLFVLRNYDGSKEKKGKRTFI